MLELNELRERYDNEREQQQKLVRELDERNQRTQHDLQQELLEVKVSGVYEQVQDCNKPPACTKVNHM